MAAAGGLTVPEAQSASASSGTTVEAGVAPVTAMESIPLDRQISALRTDTSALAQRASRAQERISLEERRKKAEAARKRLEALRPKFALPLNDFRLTASFGDSSSLWSQDHTGQDFAAPVGTPVRSVADGVIVAAGWGGPYGWRTIVRHSDGTETWYAHMSTQTRRSGKVKAGQMIGRVGSTGNTTGPHLHLEVRVNDSPINPMSWLRKNGVDI